MLGRQRALRYCLAAVAGALAAIIAHVVIDIAGDYLLVRDAYDGVAHNSRPLLLAVVALVVLISATRTIVDALRLREISLLASIRGALGRPVRFVAASTIAAIVALAAMESFDSALAHRIDDVGDIFGGSLLLGLLTVVITGALCGWLVYRLLLWLGEYERPIVALILAVLRPDAKNAAEARRPRQDDPVAFSFNAVARSARRHKRGPPAPALR